MIVVMAKRTGDGTINVQARLAPVEVAELDRAAAEQTIPVSRAALVSFVLREWLKRRREEHGRQKQEAAGRSGR